MEIVHLKNNAENENGFITYYAVSDYNYQTKKFKAVKWLNSHIWTDRDCKEDDWTGVTYAVRRFAKVRAYKFWGC